MGSELSEKSLAKGKWIQLIHLYLGNYVHNQTEITSVRLDAPIWPVYHAIHNIIKQLRSRKILQIQNDILLLILSAQSKIVSIK